MRKFTSPLEGLRVAAPCPADWEKMVGDERVRFCGQCSLHVYNLSGMTKGEAESLVAGAEGRLCVRYYRRADGSVLTRNCPVGVRALRQRVSRVAGAALSAAVGFFAGLGLNFGFSPAPLRHTVGQMVVPVKLKRTPPTVVEVPAPQEVKGEAFIPLRPTVGRMAPRVPKDGNPAPSGRRPKLTPRD
ncbi:MAG TPA: hypothetical protein VM936_04960 [Pyrinomonadaceae bacterium]|nr:hypothetical protein [Pyrinomonadaceae bacterium]